MNAELPQLGDRLLVALLNGGYQGLLVTAAVWLCLKLLPRTNAATRYAVWSLALVAVLALPLLHFVLEQSSSSPDWLLVNQTQESTGDQLAAPTERTISTQCSPPVVDEFQDMEHFPLVGAVQWGAVPEMQLESGLAMGCINDADAMPSMEDNPTTEGPTFPFECTEWLMPECPDDSPALAVNLAEEVREPKAATIGDSSGVSVQVASPQSLEPKLLIVTTSNGAAASPAVTTSEVKAAPLLRPAARIVPFAFPRFVAPTVLIALALLGVARIVALGRQLLLLREVKTASESAPDPISKWFDSICVSDRRKRPAELLVSLEAISPMVVGFLRPAILMPKHLVDTLQPAQLDPILRHELAHVRRFDDWSNLAQQGVKALFGFHPAVIWICRRLSIEREIACDDYVLHSGQKARDYALFLTEFASHRNSRNWSAAPAAWSRKTQLKERVNMILKTNRSISPRLGFARLGILSITAAALAIAMLQLAPRLSAAGQSAPPNAPVAPVQSADTAVIVSPSGQTLVVSAPQTVDVPVAVIAAGQPAPPIAPVAPVHSADTAVIVSPSGQTLVVSAPQTVDAPMAIIAAAQGTPAPRIAASGARSKDARRAPAAENSDADPSVEEPPVPATPPTPDAQPSPPRPPAKQIGNASNSNPDRSLEDRLRRVEQMLESLLHDKSIKMVVPRPYPTPEGKPDVKAFQFDYKIHPDMSWEKQTKQFELDAQRFSKRAEMDAKRAAEAFNRESAKSLAGSKDKFAATQQQLEQQRRALEGQRKALEKQLEAIEHQCDKIEQQQEKLQEEREKQEEQQREKENHNTSDNDNEDECDELVAQ